VTGACTEIRRRIERIVTVVGGVDRCLVRHDVHVAEACELLRDGGNVRVAQEDILVLFLHELEARRHDHFDDVLAGGSIGLPSSGFRVVLQMEQLVPAGRPTRGRPLVTLGNLYMPSLGRRLHLVQHRPAVVALEL